MGGTNTQQYGVITSPVTTSGQTASIPVTPVEPVPIVVHAEPVIRVGPRDDMDSEQAEGASDGQDAEVREDVIDEADDSKDDEDDAEDDGDDDDDAVDSIEDAPVDEDVEDWFEELNGGDSDGDGRPPRPAHGRRVVRPAYPTMGGLR